MIILEHLGVCVLLPLWLNRNKFDPRAKKCAFLGYPIGIKGYKVMDLSTSQFFISRDVFHESSFPFLSSSPNATALPDPFIISQSGVFHSEQSPPILPIFVPPISININLEPLSMDIDLAYQDVPMAFDGSFMDIDDFIESDNSIPPTIPTPTPPPTLRKSSRSHHPSSYLQDYKCHYAGSPYDLSYCLSYSPFSIPSSCLF